EDLMINSIESQSINENLLPKISATEKIVIGLPSLIKIGLTRNYLQTFALCLLFRFKLWISFVAFYLMMWTKKILQGTKNFSKHLILSSWEDYLFYYLF